MLTSVEWFQHNKDYKGSKDLISPLSHNCSRLSRASICSLLFDVLLDSCNNKAGIVCIAFRLIDLSDIFYVHVFKSLVTSLMHFFPAFLVGNIKIFLLQKTIFS